MPTERRRFTWETQDTDFMRMQYENDELKHERLRLRIGLSSRNFILLFILPFAFASGADAVRRNGDEYDGGAGLADQFFRGEHEPAQRGCQQSSRDGGGGGGYSPDNATIVLNGSGFLSAAPMGAAITNFVGAFTTPSPR